MLVSAVIPTYNRRKLLKEAIDSVLEQSYREYEIIVIDDGSTDGTGDALATLYGNRVRYQWQENQGESTARNLGLEIANGDYVAFLDSDDVWLPTKLAEQITALDEHNDFILCCTNAWRIDGAGQRANDTPLRVGLTEASFRPENLSFQNPIICSSVMVRKSTALSAGGFNENMIYGEDWDLWLRLALSGKIKYVDRPLVLYRQHATAQNQFPTSDKASRLLSDRLTMLHGAFATAPDRFDSNLRQRSIAHQYGLTAFTQFAAGDGCEGSENLEKAVYMWPEDWAQTGHLKEQLNQHAILATAGVDYISLKPSITFLETAEQSWPPHLIWSSKWKRGALGGAYAAAGFNSMALGDIKFARECFIQAVYLDRRWLMNIGILSTIAKSIVS